jgi:YVTN family beta-propeller protein
VRTILPETTFSSPIAVGGQAVQARFNSTGGTLYVGTELAAIARIGVASNSVTGIIRLPYGRVFNIGLRPDDTRLYALTDQGIVVTDAPAGGNIELIPERVTGDFLSAVAFHPFAPCMYVGSSSDRTITTIDLRTHAVVRRDSIPGALVQSITVSLDGTTLFVADAGNARLWTRNLTSESTSFVATPVGSASFPGAYDVAVTPDNTQLYVSALADHKVYVFDLTTRAVLDSIPVGGSPRYIAFTASGSHAVIPNSQGWVSIVH